MNLEERAREIFSRILVTAGYSPSVIGCPDGGTYQYVADDGIVVEKGNQCQ